MSACVRQPRDAVITGDFWKMRFLRARGRCPAIGRSRTRFAQLNNGGLNCPQMWSRRAMPGAVPSYGGYNSMRLGLHAVCCRSAFSTVGAALPCVVACERIRFPRCAHAPPLLVGVLRQCIRLRRCDCEAHHMRIAAPALLLRAAGDGLSRIAAMTTRRMLYWWFRFVLSGRFLDRFLTLPRAH